MFVYFLGIQLCEESNILHFKKFKHSNITLQQFEISKNKKMEASHQFQREGKKGNQIYLVVEFLKWTNILGHLKSEKMNKQMGWRD